MGCRCRGHALRQQHREICHLRWQDFGRAELRVGQPEWLHEDRRIRPGFELEQFRPFLGPHRLRLVHAIRWMHRTLDRFQTVEKRPERQENASVLAASARLNYGCRISPNYTPSAPELRLIATQLSDQIGYTKRCVSVPGKYDVKAFREVRRGSIRQCSGRSPPRHRDGSPRASRQRRRLPDRAKGRDHPGQPLVLPHRSRDQTSVLVSSGRGATSPPAPRRRFQRRRLRPQPRSRPSSRRARSRAKRFPKRARNIFPSNPAPNRPPLPIPLHKRPAQRPPHRPFRIASAPQAQMCSRQPHWPRHDGSMARA